MGRTSRLKLWVPKIMAQMVSLSRQRKLCRNKVGIFVPQLLSWPTVSVTISFCALFLNYVVIEFSMSRQSCAKSVLFLSQQGCLVSRQFLDALQLEFLNSMSRKKTSLSRLSFLLSRYFVSRHRIFVSRHSFLVFCLFYVAIEF